MVCSYFTVGYITNIRGNPHSGQPKTQNFKNVLQQYVLPYKKKIRYESWF